MAALRVPHLIVFTTVYILCGDATVVNLCDTPTGEYHGFPIFKGQDIKGAQVLQTISGTYSKAHCAVKASGNPNARAAIYQPDGKCSVLRDYYGLSNITTANTENVLIVLQNAQQALSGCPVCSRTAVCMYDCSTNPTAPQVACVELTYTPGVCDQQPIIQFKEYYMKNFDFETLTSGQAFFSVVFTKLYSWTALRIAFRGSMRGAKRSGGGGWSRYIFNFNDTACSNPATIESVHYDQEEGEVVKSNGITGLCYFLPAGNVTIALKYWTDSSSYARIGFATYGTRLFVQELGQPGYDMNYRPGNPCPALPQYNIREYYYNNDRSEDCCTTIASYYYTKLEASTTLKISWDGVLRIVNDVNNAKCSIWYLMVDGAHCSPQPIGRLLANLGGSFVINNMHRSYELEGFCQGISAGLHTIDLRIERCPWYTNADASQPDAHTGWNGIMQRFIVEEFREGSSTTAMIGADGNIYRLPQFNMAIFGWANINNGASYASMLSFSYTKMYGSSGLRLMYSGDQRSYPSQDYCCRHYFTINGVDCTNPGPIEGITYQTRIINFHRPIIMDGVCEGIAAATLTINIYSGLCKGFTGISACYFGWNSYQNILAAEVYVDREIR